MNSFDCDIHTVCPNKNGNSVTILNYSTSPWLAGTQPLNIFILQPSGAEVDKLNIVTEFPCLLGLTVFKGKECQWTFLRLIHKCITPMYRYLFLISYVAHEKNVPNIFK